MSESEVFFIARHAVPATAAAAADAGINTLRRSSHARIVSKRENVEHPGATDSECHEGAPMTATALEGDFVKIK